MIYLFDVHELSSSDLHHELEQLHKYTEKAELILAGNKIDKEDLEYTKKEFSAFKDMLFISSKEKINLEELKTRLIDIFDDKANDIPETIITNARHVEALKATFDALSRVSEGLDKKISGELLASDIRTALHHLGLITGEVSTDDLLQNIFSRFCIGK